MCVCQCPPGGINEVGQRIGVGCAFEMRKCARWWCHPSELSVIQMRTNHVAWNVIFLCIWCVAIIYTLLDEFWSALRWPRGVSCIIYKCHPALLCWNEFIIIRIRNCAVYYLISPRTVFASIREQNPNFGLNKHEIFFYWLSFVYEFHFHWFYLQKNARVQTSQGPARISSTNGGTMQRPRTAPHFCGEDVRVTHRIALTRRRNACTIAWANLVCLICQIYFSFCFVYK